MNKLYYTKTAYLYLPRMLTYEQILLNKLLSYYIKISNIFIKFQPIDNIHTNCSNVRHPTPVFCTDEGSKREDGVSREVRPSIIENKLDYGGNPCSRRCGCRVFFSPARR